MIQPFSLQSFEVNEGEQADFSDDTNRNNALIEERRLAKPAHAHMDRHLLPVRPTAPRPVPVGGLPRDDSYNK